jgi:CheY-like chemotaxis protein
MEVLPDLILMDIELPDGNGLKLTQWITSMVIERNPT